MSSCATARTVTDIVHYTTQRGIFGTIAKGALLSRARLDTDDYLEHIFTGVWPRQDAPWLDHVNLSVTRINDDLYRRSRGHWPQMWWCIVVFDIDILDADGVTFATANNIWPKTRRAPAANGFQALFADPVAGRYSDIHTRAGLAESLPTCRAAEVLYPGQLDSRAIRQIRVVDIDHRAVIRAHCETLGHPQIDVIVDPAAFA